MDHAKYLSSQVLRRTFVTCRTQFPEQASKGFVNIDHCRAEFGDRLIPARDDAIPPAFRIRKHAPGEALFGITRIECSSDRSGVGLAHQSANELLLASQCTAAVNRCCRGDGITERLIDRQCSQVLGGQADQSLTEIL